MSLPQEPGEVLSEQLSSVGQILGDRGITFSRGFRLANETTNSSHGVGLIGREVSISDTSESLPYTLDALFDRAIVSSPFVGR